MIQNPAATEWATTRGEKWRSNLIGLEAMLEPLCEPLIDALKLDAPYRIADIGCGGGATTRQILSQAPAGTLVHGFDISPALIESARANSPRDASAIAFEVADMALANPPAHLYDRLVTRFGIMFFDNPPAAFENLVRWLAPGGRFAFAVWGPLAENVWMSSVRQAVSEIIAVPPVDPEAPTPFRYADAGKLLALLQQAGFHNLNVHTWHGLLPIGGELAAPDAATFGLTSVSSFRELLAEAGDDVLNAAHQSLTAIFSQHEQGGVVRMNACVHIVTGARIS